MPTSARGRAMAPAPTMRDVSILGAPAEAQRRERALPLAAKRRIWSLRRRCHAARPPRRAIAHCSAENAAGLRPACFSVYAVLCCPAAGPPRFLSRCGGYATPHCLPLREKHLAPAAQLLFRLRGALCGCSARLRASYYISFAELIFTPGPMVEAHTQERMY